MRPAVSSHGTNRVSSMAHGTINVPIGIPTAVRVSLGVLLRSHQIEATYGCSGRSDVGQLISSIAAHGHEQRLEQRVC